MSVRLYELAMESVVTPKKLSQYRLLSIGIVMRYVFLFITCVTLSAFIHFLLGFTNANSSLHTVKHYMDDVGMAWILYPFAFLFLFVSTTLLIMLHISIVAAITIVCVKPLKRRMQYRQVWRTTALSMTVVYALYIIGPFIPFIASLLYVLSFILSLLYSIMAASTFPQARPARNS